MQLSILDLVLESEKVYTRPVKKVPIATSNDVINQLVLEGFEVHQVDSRGITIIKQGLTDDEVLLFYGKVA